MKWTRGSRSDDVEDRRGMRVSGATIGIGGGVVVIVVALVSQLLGVDLSGIFGGGGGGGGGTPSQRTDQSTSQPSQSGAGTGSSTKIDPRTDPDALLVEFITFVLNDIQDTFTQQVAAQKPFGGRAYRRAKLVIFTQAVDTGCGRSSSAIGPFYCPPDEKAYIDLSFYRELKARFGAPGDFAQAYVLAHELGHHLQQVFGINAEVEGKTTKKNRNEMSVRMELQADCFAGVWAHTARKRDLLEMGDAQEALDAATAIGDDRLAKMAGERVNPETWTHGSSAMRVRWFSVGFDAGQFAACDTFSARTL